MSKANFIKPLIRQVCFVTVDTVWFTVGVAVALGCAFVDNGTASGPPDAGETFVPYRFGPGVLIIVFIQVQFSLAGFKAGFVVG